MMYHAAKHCNGLTPSAVLISDDTINSVAVCCSVLQCVAVFCSVLQCVAVCCSVLQCFIVCCSVLHLHEWSQCAVSLQCCSIIHHRLSDDAAHCNTVTMHHTAILQIVSSRSAVWCIIMNSCRVMHCNALHHAAILQIVSSLSGSYSVMHHHEWLQSDAL